MKIVQTFPGGLSGRLQKASEELRALETLLGSDSLLMLSGANGTLHTAQVGFGSWRKVAVHQVICSSRNDSRQRGCALHAAPISKQSEARTAASGEALLCARRLCQMRLRLAER